MQCNDKEYVNQWALRGDGKSRDLEAFCVGIVIYVDFEIISIYLGVLERKINEMKSSNVGN